ncbi:hypothetical protein [Burkholderia diffusa]|uniref:hypothetical protein n=1 Tax=Burkholderia diffusa TaxID=488732 RepID=UPI002AB04EB1|nr:hypothetical protein [Burkholderia diffusa]
MIRNRVAFARAGVITASLCFVLPGGPAHAATESNAATEALIDQAVALTERGDPASMEKTMAGYLIDASKRFNANVPDNTWQSVRADVDEIISNKIRPGYGEQALLARRFIKNAKFSDDELRHLVAMLQDPVMQRWTVAMRDGDTTRYMAALSQQVNNQMWSVVSIVLRRHGLQTSDTPVAAKQKQ